MSTGQRPVALVTAPFRGEGLTTLGKIADVVLDPWIDQTPLRIYGPEELAARAEREGAEIVICEADFCMGPLLDVPLRRGFPFSSNPPSHNEEVTQCSSTIRSSRSRASIADT